MAARKSIVTALYHIRAQRNWLLYLTHNQGKEKRAFMISPPPPARKKLLHLNANTKVSSAACVRGKCNDGKK